MPTYPWGENWDDCYNTYYKKRTERIIDDKNIVTESEARAAFHDEVLMPDVRNAVEGMKKGKGKPDLKYENHSFWHAYRAGDFNDSIKGSVGKIMNKNLLEAPAKITERPEMLSLPKTEVVKTRTVGKMVHVTYEDGSWETIKPEAFRPW